MIYRSTFTSNLEHSFLWKTHTSPGYPMESVVLEGPICSGEESDNGGAFNPRLGKDFVVVKLPCDVLLG